MDLIFLRRLTLECMPLRLVERSDIEAYKALAQANLVEGKVVGCASPEPHVVVDSVTPYGRIFLAQKQRRTG